MIVAEVVIEVMTVVAEMYKMKLTASDYVFINRKRKQKRKEKMYMLSTALLFLRNC